MNCFGFNVSSLNKPLSLSRAKPLYEKISTNVWMKPEGGDYRCLIGPYSTFSDARKRSGSGACGLDTAKPLFVWLISIRPRHSLSLQKTGRAKMVKPKAPVPKPAAPTPETCGRYSPRVSRNECSRTKRFLAMVQVPVMILISKFVTANVAGNKYAVPYLSDHKQQFYMEQESLGVV